MEIDKEKGISVIVCCFNSAGRIGRTLRSLAGQRLKPYEPYEVILVDNASTDGTAAVARGEWDRLHIVAPLRIVDQPIRGLAHARRQGITAARYDFLVFCDDDNWLSENYVGTAAGMLREDNLAAACGGLGIPVFDRSAPVWFSEYAEVFATGPQIVCDRNNVLLSLFGAGLMVRKNAIHSLEKAGFRPVMTGRSGTLLSSGEDTELTNAFVLAGYRLIYSPDLVFHHYMPESRMNIGYLKKLFVSLGHDGPVMNLYNAYLQPGTPQAWLKNWNMHLLATLVRMAKYMMVPPKKYGRLIYLAWSMAYLKSLWKGKGNYRSLRRDIEKVYNDTGIRQPEQITVMSMFIPGNEYPLLN
jgi:glycosyltransferase involved in cell wall biosynthesis